MPPKAPEDGAKPAPPKRVRKAAPAVSVAKSPARSTSKPVAQAAAAEPMESPPSAKPVASPAADSGQQRRIGGGWLAVGVGSAALVAALLFATRGKRNDWSK